jgi:hypothetical protein
MTTGSLEPLDRVDQGFIEEDEERFAMGDGARPQPVPVRDRVRRLPGAVLLAAGYFASRARWVRPKRQMR